MKEKVMALGLAFLMSTLSVAYSDDNVKPIEATAEQAPEHRFCPVCGPEEEMEELAFSYKHEGKKHLFCSLDCMKAFKKNPEQYLKVEKAG
jgi:YHS domain-containing protein